MWTHEDSIETTKIIYSTEITGPGADDFGPMVTSDFPEVLTSLKTLAEQP